jgi:hypothetical protein
MLLLAHPGAVSRTALFRIVRHVFLLDATMEVSRPRRVSRLNSRGLRAGSDQRLEVLIRRVASLDLAISYPLLELAERRHPRRSSFSNLLGCHAEDLRQDAGCDGSSGFHTAGDMPRRREGSLIRRCATGTGAAKLGSFSTNFRRSSAKAGLTDAWRRTQGRISRRCVGPGALELGAVRVSSPCSRPMRSRTPTLPVWQSRAARRLEAGAGETA